MKRRVYVMDCGGFVKIGVSLNAEQRRKKLPCGINQYYCTEPIDNAFEIERFMRKVYAPLNRQRKTGRECFNSEFACVCDVPKSAIESTEVKRKQIESAVIELNSEGREGFDNDFYKFVEIVLKSSVPDLTFITFIMQGLKAGSVLLNREFVERR